MKGDRERPLEPACVTSSGNMVTFPLSKRENRWRAAMGKIEFPIAESSTTSMSRCVFDQTCLSRVRNLNDVE